MKDRIKLLPESVANQIAAGEVVNRPSSVVKELLENAIDAGARNISVNFRDGGKALIQVVDDGCGMSDIDARLAFDRHATSKISDVEDIYSLDTFGFRGEALASIASVSEVQLRTRMHGNELGTQVELHGGKFVSQEPCNCPDGTQFLIRNLFYNVPARRRFLEKSTTETRHIITEYQRVALCHPEVAFTLYDSDTVLSKLPAAGLKQRIVDVIGKSVAKNLLEVSAETTIVTISGYVGRPESARQTNKEQFLFVNGRYFKSPYFSKAVLSAYDKLIPSNTQPSFFLYLTVDPEQIDVNVHPQKTEVKFAEGSNMWQIINAAVRESLAKSGAVPPMDFSMDTSVEIPVFREKPTFRQPGITSNPDFNPFEKYPLPDGNENYIESGRNNYYPTPNIQGRIWDESDTEGDYEKSVLEFIDSFPESQAALPLDGSPSEYKILPFRKRYFVTVSEQGLVFVDIRHAHEAVYFDRYVKILGNGLAASQKLLFPERIILSSDDRSLLVEYIEDFRAFGFDLSLEDEHTVEILALPADFTSAICEDLIYDLLDELREGTGNAPDIRRNNLAARMAREVASQHCGKTASVEELTALFAELVKTRNPSFTPEGAKVMVSISEEQFRKFFD